MQYAKITNSIVENVILADADFVATLPGEWVECTGKEWGVGWAYDGTIAHAPEPEPAPADPCQWLIDIGPFYDRFGAAKMAVLTSADAGVKAILQDVNIRKWVDLTRPDVAQSLAYVGSKVPTVTPELQTAILTAPVAPVENVALRKLYFS